MKGFRWFHSLPPNFFLIQHTSKPLYTKFGAFRRKWRSLPFFVTYRLHYYCYQPWKNTANSTPCCQNNNWKLWLYSLKGGDIVRSLHLQTVKERRDYFLCVLMFKCIHGLAANYFCNDVAMYVDIHGYDTRGGKIWIYTCHVASRTFTREVLVIWLPIYGISYLPMLKNQQLLTHLNKIISIRKVGWNNVARFESTNHRCAVYSYMCTRFIAFTYSNVNDLYS